jgi:hypothetical protein
MASLFLEALFVLMASINAGAPAFISVVLSFHGFLHKFISSVSLSLFLIYPDLNIYYPTSEY